MHIQQPHIPALSPQMPLTGDQLGADNQREQSKPKFQSEQLEDPSGVASTDALASTSQPNTTGSMQVAKQTDSGLSTSANQASDFRGAQAFITALLGASDTWKAICAPLRLQAIIQKLADEALALDARLGASDEWRQEYQESCLQLMHSCGTRTYSLQQAMKAAEVTGWASSKYDIYIIYN
jgi:hypothetical protein